MPAHLAERYKRAQHQVRVVSEGWGKDNLYCPNCQSPFLSPAPNNTPAYDFVCPRCSLYFQLKSKGRPIGGSIADAAYSAMMQAILEDRTPNLYALHYSKTLLEGKTLWEVRNLILVPHFAFPASAIEKRRPTTPEGRGSAWVSCNILLRNIPPDAKIKIVADGVPTPPYQVRESFHRLKPLKDIPPLKRGWTLDVLRIVRSLAKTMFSNNDLYAFESYLKGLYPNNNTIRDQIRKQLQILRDKGFLIQVKQGVWAVRNEISPRN